MSEQGKLQKAFGQYLLYLRMIGSTGASVPETSYYSTLETLLNEVGKALKPKVRCILQLANVNIPNVDKTFIYTRTTERYLHSTDGRKVEAIKSLQSGA